MKLTSIEICPDGSSITCDLSFKDPKRKHSFNITEVLGLDADEIIPRYYGVSDNKALRYYNLMIEYREVIFKIQLNPDFSINESYSDLREVLFKMIASSRTGVVTIKFKNGNDVVAILKGYIKKFEASSSEKTPEVQLTVSCIDPMLKGPDKTIVDITGYDPNYTILTDNLSTAPHGFAFELVAIGAFSNLIIEDKLDSNWAFTVTPSGGFLAGDVLFFSSETNNKYLYVISNGSKIHLADVISFESIWPIMFPGENHFTLSNSARLNWQAINYTTTYWGI